MNDYVDGPTWVRSMVVRKRKSGFRYIAFNKPFGVLSSFTDSLGKSTLSRYLTVPKVYPVGRLDYDSEGLMLLTDDGDLSHRIAAPTGEIWKSYLVQVERIPQPSALEQLRRGVVIRHHRTRPAKVTLLEEEPTVWPRPVPIRFRKSVPTSWLLIKIHEGKNRQIRRMTAAVGHATLRLIRVAIGPIQLDHLQSGTWRDLEKNEVRALRTACGNKEKGQDPARMSRKKK